MNVIAILNVISMLIQLGIVCFCMRIVYSIREYGVLICIHDMLRGEYECFKWLSHNIYYLGYLFLGMFLSMNVIIQASQFSQGQIYIKPIYQFILSPFVWVSVATILVGHYKAGHTTSIER